MPIYEYKCNNCQHHFEVMQKIGDNQITCCPVCKLDTAEKLLSAPSFHLKGTGWYATDKNQATKPKAETSTKEEKIEKKVD